MVMPQPARAQFLSLEKTEDQLAIGVFALVLLSFFFGLQGGLIPSLLWAALGMAALFCMYFAFPNMWPYALLLYAAYGIAGLAAVLLIFWYNAVMYAGISFPALLGALFIFAAFFMAFHMIQYIKKARDILTEEQHYVPLGFWSLAVMLFVAFSLASIISWALWTTGSVNALRAYMVLEPLLAFMLVYILWLPDRALDWSRKVVPESPATRFIVDKSRIITGSIGRGMGTCPECGQKLRNERKSCPSCNNAQDFGWCPRSEAYVLPCSDCGSMNFYGKESCEKCGKRLSTTIQCSACSHVSHLREWSVPT